MSNSKPTSVNVLEQIIVLNEDGAKKPPSQASKGEAHKPVILNKLMSKKNYIEMEEHPDLISPAHAVPSSNTEGMSDDDGTKVILTLDTVESALKESDIHPNFIEITEIKSEFDDPPAEHFVQQKNGTTGKQAVSSSIEMSELAKRQLQQLSYSNPKKRALKTQMVRATEDEDPLRISESEVPESAVKELKKTSGRTTNLVLSKVKTEKQAIDSENDHKEEITKNEDLIAILEGQLEHDNGDDEPENIEEYELVTVTESADAEESSQLELSKEEIKKIAAQQLMNIPNRQRGRKPRDASKNDAPKNEIVKSLVSDWSDTEKDTDTKQNVVHVEKKVIKKEKDIPKAPIEPPIVPFRRTRVIKKKIIWDPDAPETQFSYASLVQSSAKKAVKKPAPKPITSTPKPASPANVMRKVEVKINRTKSNPTPPIVESKVKILNSLKRRSETPPNLLNKKKKVSSEVDRLLSDEGVANMVHSLENESSIQKELKGMKKLTVNLEKTQVKKEPLVKKRQTKQSASSSWDYVYNQKTDDSLIIRRRSNSSYSSASPRRLSIDHTPIINRQAGAKTRNFEFAKPGLKKLTKTTPGSTPTSASPADRSPVEVRKSTRGSCTPEVKEEVSPQRITVGDVAVKRHGDVVQLILKPKVEKVKNSFTIELMKSVTNELNNLQKDNTCKVVFITAAGPHFCQGIDFLPLTQGTVDKRKTAANELANCTKNFLLSLASFTKPLLAGITGACSGVGVTMLPLFDVVIASDKCTFETPYAKIGQLPEGYSALSLTNNVRHNFKTKLIYLCEKLNATEAALGGLVTKIEIPVKVTEETLQCAKKIASLSQQTFASVKMQRRKGELEKLSAALNEEFKMIVQHWTGSECFEKFKHYLLTESW